jgi:hypothetical protein
MCVSCGCHDPAEDHGDVRNITTLTLQGAADWAGTDIAGVLENMNETLKGASPKTLTGGKIQKERYAAVNVVKAADEQRYTLGLAYPAMRPDSARAADGHIDFVSEEVLEKTAWNWMAKSRDVNLHHQGGTSGHATVVESYIYRGPDWLIESPMDGKKYAIKAGDWLLGTVWDEYGWNLVKNGYINGWSPQGGAKRATPTQARLAQLRSN